MELSIDLIKKLAKLSRIKLKDDELLYYKEEVSEIVTWLEQLNEVDVSNVEPLLSSVTITLPLRKDEVIDGDIQKEILSNAPKEVCGHFAVRKVIE